MVLLNGWQRLWIVACVALLIALGTLAYNGNFPTENRIRQQHEYEMSTFREQLECVRIKGKVEQAKSSLVDQIVSRQPCITDDASQLMKGMDESKQRFEDTSSHLLMLQIESAGWIGAGWLIGCALLYALGALVAWVIRGFRHKGTITS